MKQAVLTSKVSITIMFDLHSLFKFEGPAFKRIWGYSSAGRAPALQAGGQRFDPAYLHQKEEPKCGAQRGLTTSLIGLWN